MLLEDLSPAHDQLGSHPSIPRSCCLSQLLQMHLGAKEAAGLRPHHPPSPLCHAGGLRGATVVDALDTLYIMELEEEFQEAKKWVEESFDLNVVSQPLGMPCSASLCPPLCPALGTASSEKLLGRGAVKNPLSSALLRG